MVWYQSDVFFHGKFWVGKNKSQIIIIVIISDNSIIFIIVIFLSN